MTNYLHQQKQIGDGFSSQGLAIFRVGQYHQSYEWSGKGLEYLQTIKKDIPPKQIKEREYQLYILMNCSLVQMPYSPEKRQKLE